VDRVRETHPRAAALDREEVFRDLKEIRERGYALSRSGWLRGVNSVASAIGRQQELPIAAVAIAGPAERMSDERMETLAGMVLNAATRVAQTLGLE
jgi:DNA-binding IclR family transcriptional regulator